MPASFKPRPRAIKRITEAQSQHRKQFRSKVCWAVMDLIHDYGDTVFGDKPEGMCLAPSRF